MFIKYNCRFFKGNVPCQYHKKRGFECDNCASSKGKGKKILLIKLFAIGDVLRTTFILELIKKKFKDSYIVWLTSPDAAPLLFNNEFIDEIAEYNAQVFSRLSVEKFDIVFNPSNDRESSVLAAMAKAGKKFGFIYHRNGYIKPLCKMARYYLEMGSNDIIKKANKLTYQEIVAGMLGADFCFSNPIFRLTNEEKAFSRRFKEENSLSGRLVIGLNTGAGERWQLKKLSVAKTIELARCINKELNAKIILFGGPKEQQRNKEILAGAGDILIDSKCGNSLREFASIINLVDVMVSSDTLGLHLAVALNKYVIGIFGPTSYSEVELYSKGEKIYSKGMDCLGCYKNNCSLEPNCMDKVDINEVLAEIKKFVNAKIKNPKI